jgi:hypothetical protein
MTSELDRMIGNIVDRAAMKVLRPAGFAGRRRRFWRSRSDLEHLVIFERQSRFEKGVTELWATAAVFVPGYYKIRYLPFPEPKRNRIKPTDCVVWATADRLVRDTETTRSPADLIVDLHHGEARVSKLADEMEFRLTNFAIPFLDMFNTIGDLVNFLTHPRSGLGSSARTSDILDLEATAVLYALLENCDKAVECIDLAIGKTKVADARKYQCKVRDAIREHCAASQSDKA